MPIQTDAPWQLDCIDKQQGHTGSHPTNQTGTFEYTFDGTGVRLYIVDNGVYAAHQEFTGRIAPGYTAPGSGSGDHNTPTNNHGTGMAGVAAGTTTGVAKGATIVPVRFYATVPSVADYDSPQVMNAWRNRQRLCLEWIRDNHPSGVRGVIATAFNFQFFGEGTYDADITAYRAVVSQLLNMGFAWAMSAGNSNEDLDTLATPWRGEVHPDFKDRQVFVGNNGNSSTHSRNSSSNYGSPVDIYAPGSSTRAPNITGTTAYFSATGTSYSAPLLSGVMATLLQQNANLTPAQVKQIIIDGAHVGMMTGLTAQSNNRLLYSKLTAPVQSQAPSVPGNFQVSLTGTTASLTWNASAGDGDIRYRIEHNGTNIVNAQIPTSRNVENLTVGTHSFRVQAHSQFGTSAWTSIQSVTVGASSWIVIDNVTSSPHSILGLQNGAQYEIQQEPVGADGTSFGWSNSVIGTAGTSAIIKTSADSFGIGLTESRALSISPVSKTATDQLVISLTESQSLPTTPGIPTNFSAVRNDAQGTPPTIVLSATAPSGTGLTYDVRHNGNIIATGLSQPTYVHQGVTRGIIHRYEMRAVNTQGPGNWTSVQWVGVAPNPPVAVPGGLGNIDVSGLNPVGTIQIRYRKINQNIEEWSVLTLSWDGHSMGWS